MIERPRLRYRLYSLLNLGIRLKQHFESFLLPERGHEHFLLDLSLSPVQVVRHLYFCVAHRMLAQIFAEPLQQDVIDLLGQFAEMPDSGAGARSEALRDRLRDMVAEEKALLVVRQAELGELEKSYQDEVEQAQARLTQA